MKKIFTLLATFMVAVSANSQTLLINNSSLTTHPGAGPSGTDVSATQTALGATLFGSGQNRATGYWMASKIIVPASGWMIDSLITYGYQTGSSLVSTFTGLYCYIGADSSSKPSSTVVIGSKTTNAMVSSVFSGIYRLPNETAPFTNTTRPIMKIKSTLTGSLSAGTYWVTWNATGSLASGPWNPPITVLGNLNTGTGTSDFQFVPTATPSPVWSPVMDGTSPQGLPFKLYGQGIAITGVKEQALVTSVSVGPNPMSNEAVVTIDAAGTNLSDLSFVVFDQLGRQVMTNNSITSSSFTIEKGNLATGNYIYKLSNKKDNSTLKAGKLIIQ
ncbi:MAG: T9SS type A sorting domain-containing protein [Bacteroidetes bacterium]|nr:T9SS type A sorting domain-containing protein [Bacteroidota bacterium]